MYTFKKTIYCTLCSSVNLVFGAIALHFSYSLAIGMQFLKKNKIVIVPRGPLHFLRVALEAAVHMSFILDTDLLFKNTIEENF